MVPYIEDSRLGDSKIDILEKALKTVENQRLRLMQIDPNHGSLPTMAHYSVSPTAEDQSAKRAKTYNIPNDPKTM